MTKLPITGRSPIWVRLAAGLQQTGNFLRSQWLAAIIGKSSGRHMPSKHTHFLSDRDLGGSANHQEIIVFPSWAAPNCSVIFGRRKPRRKVMWRFGKFVRLLPVSAAVALATGCGGDDNTPPSAANVSSSPASTPSPGPTPTPSPTFSTVPFALGQPAGFRYAVLGYRVAAKAGPFENISDPATIDATIPIGLAYAGSGKFLLSVGGLGEGWLDPNGGGGIASADGRTTQFGFNALGGAGSIGEALDFEARPLTSTAWGYLSITARTTLYYADDYSFVYGVPTASTAVPTSGFAEFRSCCESRYPEIKVEYATGVMTATRLGDGITFIDVVLGTDRATFSGRVMTTDGEGTVEGRFTGADGEELMMRLIVPGKAAYLFAMRRVELPDA